MAAARARHSGQGGELGGLASGPGERRGDGTAALRGGARGIREWTEVVQGGEEAEAGEAGAVEMGILSRESKASR